MNTIFAATEKAIHALNPSTGEQKWRAVHETIGETFTPTRLTVAGNRLLAVGHRRLVAFDTNTGQQDWTFTAPGTEQTASIMENAVTIVNNTAYACAINSGTASFETDNPYSRIYALDLGIGNQRIFREFSISKSRPIPRYLVGDKRGLFCLLDGRLIAFSFDGEVQWRSDDPDGNYSSPVLSDSVILVGDTVTAFDIATGRQLWQDSEMQGHFTVESGVGYATSGTTPEGEGKLTAFDPEDGTHYWEAKTRGKSSTPAVGGGAVFLSVTDTNRGYLTAFDAEHGCRLGSFKFLSGEGKAPVVGAGRVSVTGGEWQKRTLWSFDLP